MKRQALDPGRLRHRVMLQVRLAPDDAQGGEGPESWSDVAPLSAMLETGPVRREADADVDGVRSALTVTIRYRDDVAPGMRLLFRGRELMIRTVSDPDERRTYLQLGCEEETP